MSSQIIPFLLGALQSLSRIGCLALESPSSNNGISLCFSTSRSSLYNNSESFGGIYTMPIEVYFPFISTRFQIASRLDCILLTKTLLLSFFVRVATPNPSFFSVTGEWKLLFQFHNISELDCILLKKTLLLSFFIRVATPNPSFFQ